MSWDLWAHCPTCDTECVATNYTNNMNDAIRGAGLPDWPWGMSGRPASDVADDLADVVAEIEARRSEFERLNSPNGWGSISTLIPVLERTIAGLRRIPDADVRLSA